MRLSAARKSRTVEAAHQDTLTQNVSIDRFQYIRSSGVRPEVEFRIEREEFERVVMIGACSARARSTVADNSALILQLDRAVGKLGIGVHVSGEFLSGSRNIEYQPV